MIDKGSYAAAVQLLMNRSQRAVDDIRTMLHNNAQREMTIYLKHAVATCAKVNRTTVEAFSWKDILDETQQYLPLLHTVLQGSLLCRGGDKDKLMV